MKIKKEFATEKLMELYDGNILCVLLVIDIRHTHTRTVHKIVNFSPFWKLEFQQKSPFA